MKKNIKLIPRFSKKVVIILSVLILIAASQWWAVRMVYDKKFNNNIAYWLARTYHLQAGKIVAKDQSLTVPLASYIKNYNFATIYLKEQATKAQESQGQNFQLPDDNTVKEAVWHKVAKEQWLTQLARQNKISLTQQDVDLALKEVPDLEAMKKSIQDTYQVNFATYQELVIRPSLLEAKVYKYLLENYNDRAGIERAQAAYQALAVDKKDFTTVAKQYSDDLTYVDNSWFIKTDELNSDFAEPIKQLQPGEFSKIIITPGNPGSYVILKLVANSKDATTSQEVKELRGLAIKAKSIDDFFNDFLNQAQVKRWYQ